MAGVTGHRNITNGLFQMLLQGERTMNADVDEAALEAGIAGQEAIKDTIDKTPSSLSPGKNNRNWTFEMNHSVDSSVRRSGTTRTIRAGWLQNKEGYFLIQEHGGEVRGTTIEPMNALMAGQNEMLKTLSRWGIKIR